MVSKKDSYTQRLRRHKRVRGAVSGTAQRPRLNVFRSSKNIFAQIIDDVAGVTLVSASALEKAFEGIGSNKAAARTVGKTLAERAAAKKEKDFAKADAIREELLAKGVAIKDTREGVKWELV